MAARTLGRSDAHALEEHGAEDGARGVGGEEDAVPGAGLVGAQMMRVLRHLRLERVADEERGRAAEHGHRDDPPVGARLADDAQEIAEPTAAARGAAARPPWRVCPV